LRDGAANTAIGHLAGVSLISGGGNFYIGEGAFGTTSESNQTYIRNINTTVQPLAAGTVDYVTVRLTDGRLGHTASSRRYKEDIKLMDKASELLFALKPVTFRYKKEIDPKQTVDFGLIAEDVAKLNPELAVRDGNGEITSIRYNAIDAMLLNEFLKEHKKVEELEDIVASLAATVKEQASQIQKVSAQLEVSKRAPQLVQKNQ
jgi:trimeric autotransporter adhesin